MNENLSRRKMHTSPESGRDERPERILKEIEHEPVPVRLLELARRLQSELKKRKHASE